MGLRQDHSCSLKCRRKERNILLSSTLSKGQKAADASVLGSQQKRDLTASIFGTPYYDFTIRGRHTHRLS